MNRILVTGGTGVLGSVLVRKLQQQQADFLMVSRHVHRQNPYSTIADTSGIPWQRADLTTGEGLGESLAGVDTVFHLTGGTETIGGEHVEVVAIRNLLAAARQAGVKHLIYISIVGIDRISFPYYQVKEEVEAIIQHGDIPYSILRTTQFHNLIEFFIGKLIRFPIGLIPKRAKAQPISVEAAANALLALGEAGPQRIVHNLGGPETLTMETMVRQWQNHQPHYKLVLPMPIIGSLLSGAAKGYNTCPEVAADSCTWEEYLNRKAVASGL